MRDTHAQKSSSVECVAIDAIVYFHARIYKLEKVDWDGVIIFKFAEDLLFKSIKMHNIYVL